MDQHLGASGADVDTRLLRYFVAVAEEGGFTAAAERLFVSQPGLSRAIRQLERDLGVELFVRTSRSVRLSAAGQALLPAATELLASWTAGRRAARSAEAAGSQVLRLGFESTGAGKLTTRARAGFAERHPGVTVEPRRYDWGGEVPALKDGQVDVAFIWLPNDTTGLHIEIVAEEGRAVGMPSGHRLAAKDSLSIDDLRDEPMPWARNAPIEWVNWWAVIPRPDGSEPVWGPPNDNAEELLEHVASGSGISIVAASIAAYYQRPEIVWRPLLGVDPLRIALGWPIESTHPLIPAFADVVREQSRVTYCPPPSA